MSSLPKKPKAKKGFRAYVKASTGSPALVEGVGLASTISLVPSDDIPSNTASTANVGSNSPRAETIGAPIDASANIGTSAEGGIVQPPTSAKRKIGSATWAALEASLRQLKEKSTLFPPLASAAGAVLSCLVGLESLEKNQKGFEDLSKELTGLSESLKEQMRQSSSVRITNSILNVVAEIDQQGKEVKAKLDRGTLKGIRDARADEEELLRHYERIQQLFRRLQVNAELNTWSIANEHLANTRLEGLQPSKQAAYDSSLSAEINRRGCAEGTRVGVLTELDEWLHNPTSPPVYWMNGMPGTGKTTIACTFAERLENHKLLAASFFCTRSSADCKNVTRIVPTIAYQLARYSIPFQSALCKVLGQDPDLGTKNMVKQFERLLKEPLANAGDAMPDNLVVVIDALDECEDRHGVERILDLLFRHANNVPLKFLVTSRPEPEICDKMNLNAQSVVVIRLHDIEESLTRVDIELYLKQELTFVSATADQIKQLVRRSGNLFIYAATLTRYVWFGGQSADSHQRLLLVLSMASGYESERSSSTTESGSTSEFMSAIGSIGTSKSTIDKDYTKIDALYIALLESAMGEAQLEDNAEDLKQILQTVLMAQEPIPAGVIAALAGVDNLDRMTNILQSLRFVLHESEDNGLVSVLHASFPDFVFDKERSGRFHCSVGDQSLSMARRCFEVMKGQLRFNICDLESSFIPDEEVKTLEGRMKKNIQPALAYACRYWAKHLEYAPISEVLLIALGDFLSDQLLFWMEVLNLRREIGKGVELLIKARSWLSVWPELPEVALLAEDACNFVTAFACHSIPTPHIYVSWLPFYPRRSLVHKSYWKRTRGLLELNGTLLRGGRELQVIAPWNLSSEIQSAAYLPDGGRIAVKCGREISIRSAFDGTVLVGPLGDNYIHGHFACSADGALVACGSDSASYTIRIWDTHNGSLVTDSFEGHTDYVSCVSFSPDSTRIVSASRDCTVRIWDVNTGGLLTGPLTEHYMRISCIAFPPNGAYIATGSRDFSICLRNAHDGSLVSRPLYGHGYQPNTLTFSPDSTLLIAGYSDGIITVWGTSDGSLLTDDDQFRGHTGGGVYSIAVSPDGTHMASASDKTVRIWKPTKDVLFQAHLFATIKFYRFRTRQTAVG